jgi:hypothetical protein
MSIEAIKKRAETIQSQAERLQLQRDCLVEASQCLKKDSDQYQDLTAIFMLRDPKGVPLIKASSLDVTAFQWSILKNKMKTLLVLARSGWYGSEIDKIYDLYKSIQSAENQNIMSQLLSVWRTKILMDAYSELIAVSAMVCVMFYFAAPFWVFEVFAGIIAASCTAGVLLSDYGEMLFFPSYPNVLVSDDFEHSMGTEDVSRGLEADSVKSLSAPGPALL